MAEVDSTANGIEKAGKRLLALLALVATIIAIAMLVSSWEGDNGKSSEVDGRKVTTTVEKQGEPTPKEYVIEAGDTLVAIADRYGISLKRIERLNPHLDTNTLATGNVLTLR